MDSKTPSPAGDTTSPVGSRWLAGLRRAHRGLPGPGSTPFTFWYIAVLLVTTVVLLTVPSRIARLLLTWSSTDVYHLHSAPLRVLVSSALWLPGMDWLLYSVLFCLVLAPVERRVGSRWAAAMFASGHLIATLVTELPVAWAIRHGYLPHRAGHRLDVGVSYGFYAMLGVLVGLVPRWAVAPAALGGVTIVVVPLFTSADLLSAVGHVVALAVGFCWWPWLTRRGLDESLRRRRTG